MVNDLQSRGISEPSFALMQKIGKTSKSAIDKLLSSQGV